MLKISFKFAEAMGDTEIGKIERKKRSFLYYYPTSTTNNGFTSNEAGWAVQFRSTNGYLVLNKIIPNTFFCGSIAKMEKGRKTNEKRSWCLQRITNSNNNNINKKPRQKNTRFLSTEYNNILLYVRASRFRIFSMSFKSR